MVKTKKRKKTVKSPKKHPQHFSKYSVEIPEDFDVIDAIEQHTKIEAQVEKQITQSLFWKMLYKAIGAGHAKGHIFHDVDESHDTAYVRGVGFLSLAQNCFCIPIPSATKNPDKLCIRIHIQVAWLREDAEYSDDHNDKSHWIDVPYELLSTESKPKINAWIISQRKWANNIRLQNAKEEAGRYIKGNPEILKYVLEMAETK